MLLVSGYGIFQAIGTSNFYANGGKSQTGCSKLIRGISVMRKLAFLHMRKKEADLNSAFVV